MDEKINETVEQGGEFDGIFGEGSVTEIKSARRHHHHHHHHSASEDKKSSRDDKKRSKKSSSAHKRSSRSKEAAKDKKLNMLKSLKKYFISGWVALLTIAVIVLIVLAVELISVTKSHTEKLDVMNGNVPADSTPATTVDPSVNTGYTVPVYWQDAVNEAADKVQTYLDEAGRDAAVFAWFSDVHYDLNSKNTATGAITAAVMDKCNISYAISTGDMLTQSVLGSEEAVVKAYEAAYKMLSPIGSDRLLQVEGNHDGSWGVIDLDGNGKIEDGEHYKFNMTDEKIYNYMFRQHSGDSRRVYGDEGTWFYIDDTASKTRYIMLCDVWSEHTVNEINGAAVYNQMGDYGFGQSQLTWLANEALSFTEGGWDVVIAAHVPISQDSFRDGDVARGILDAFENGTSYKGTSGEKGTWQYVDISVDFSRSHTGEIIGFFSGHVHRDSIYAELPYPVVTITSNVNTSYDEREEKREYGTDNEVAVDFVVVNKRTKEVNIVRLGVGSDRIYKY